MKFCPICENLLIVRPSVQNTESDLIKYVCRLCFHEEDVDPNDVLFENKRHFKDIEELVIHCHVNQYSMQDPTLPVMDRECTTCNNTKQQHKYIRYSTEPLKFIYICLTCETISVTGNKKWDLIEKRLTPI